MGDDPKLAVGMMNDRHGFAGGGADGPTAAEKVNLVIGVDAAAQVQRQVPVQQAGVGTVAPGRAPLGLRLGTGLLGRQAGGAAEGAVLPGQFAGEQFLGGGVGGDGFTVALKSEASGQFVGDELVILGGVGAGESLAGTAAPRRTRRCDGCRRRGAE